ncbi:hypothetical protein JHK82_055702 [Glycine max]|nr:hypothetical protein JHK82_055702 [Glycine max]
MNARGDEGADWPFPRSIPSCISLNLKTCEEEETKKQRKVVLASYRNDPTIESARLRVKQISTVATTTTSSGNKIREILGNHNYNKLGLPFNEQKYLANVIVDTILDNALALVLHLIQVLGLLHEGKALALVVKLVPTQDLMLDGSSSSSYSSSCLREHPPYQEPLDWPTRKRVGLGSAMGLSYLHDHCDPKIIHCDLKAVNILLVEEFEAVVGGFGLAKLMD